MEGGIYVTMRITPNFINVISDKIVAIYKLPAKVHVINSEI